MRCDAMVFVSCADFVSRVSAGGAVRARRGRRRVLRALRGTDATERVLCTVHTGQYSATVDGLLRSSTSKYTVQYTTYSTVQYSSWLVHPIPSLPIPSDSICVIDCRERLRCSTRTSTQSRLTYWFPTELPSISTMVCNYAKYSTRTWLVLIIWLDCMIIILITVLYYMIGSYCDLIRVSNFFCEQNPEKQVHTKHKINQHSIQYTTLIQFQSSSKHHDLSFTYKKIKLILNYGTYPYNTEYCTRKCTVN